MSQASNLDYVFDNFIEANWPDEGPYLHDFLLAFDKLSQQYNDGKLVGIALIDYAIKKLQAEANEYMKNID